MAKATEGTELKRLVSLIRYTENLHAEQVNKMEGTPIRVDPLSPKQAAPAGDLLAVSHADYPSFRHLFPDAATRGRVLRRFMTAVARDAAAHAQALVAHDKSSFLGVALWMPPGSYPLSPRRKLQMTPALH